MISYIWITNGYLTFERYPVKFPLKALRYFKFEMPANRRVNIHSSWFCLFKVAIHIYQICYNPCGTLSLGVSAMPSPIGKSASMIGGYYNKPVFIKVFLPILHGFPDTQIGRASCRERGAVTEWCGVVEKNSIYRRTLDSL